MINTLLYPEDLVQRQTTSFDDTILSIMSENVCSHVVSKLKMDGGCVRAISTATEKRPVWPLSFFSAGDKIDNAIYISKKKQF